MPSQSRIFIRTPSIQQLKHICASLRDVLLMTKLKEKEYKKKHNIELPGTLIRSIYNSLPQIDLELKHLPNSLAHVYIIIIREKFLVAYMQYFPYGDITPSPTARYRNLTTPAKMIMSLCTALK